MIPIMCLYYSSMGSCNILCADETDSCCTADNFQVSIGVNKVISFSSYPGFLESLDDFYILGNTTGGGMVMLVSQPSASDVHQHTYTLYLLRKPQTTSSTNRSMNTSSQSLLL